MFDFIESKALQNVVRQPDGITCACPVCRAQGQDKTGNHLKIFTSGKFHCIRDGSKDHNRALYNLLYKGEDLEIIFTPQEPKTKVIKIYDESMLNRLTPDYSYWEGRGIQASTVKLLGGGVASPSEKGKLAGRFSFPLRDMDGRIIGWAGRLIADNQFSVKWKNLGAIKEVVFPLNVSKPYIDEKKSVILIESIGDWCALYQHGIRNTLVIFGLNISSRMIGFLVSLNLEKIIISTNNDIGKGNKDAGNNAALKIKNTLTDFFDEERLLIHLPKSNDWGVAQDAEFEELRKVI